MTLPGEQRASSWNWAYLDGAVVWERNITSAKPPTSPLVEILNMDELYQDYKASRPPVSLPLVLHSKFRRAWNVGQTTPSTPGTRGPGGMVGDEYDDRAHRSDYYLLYERNGDQLKSFCQCWFDSTPPHYYCEVILLLIMNSRAWKHGVI
jgi:hypothetical protein